VTLVNLGSPVNVLLIYLKQSCLALQSFDLERTKLDISFFLNLGYLVTE